MDKDGESARSAHRDYYRQEPGERQWGGDIVARYLRRDGGSVEGVRYVRDQIIVKFSEDVAAAIEGKRAGGGSLSELKLGASIDKLNRKYKARKGRALFKNFKEKREQRKVLLKKDESELTKRERHILKRLKRADKNVKVANLAGVYAIEVDPEEGQSLEEVVEAYTKDAGVEYAELNYIVSTSATPNDPCYPLLWALHNTGDNYPSGGGGAADADIDAPEAWDLYTGNSDVIVAVVDSGVDYEHRDLSDNIWTNEAELNGEVGVDDDGNGYVDDIYGYDFINGDSDPRDDYGHGTHCSGTIAAKGNNGLDMTGICWDARIMGLKFLGSGGFGETAAAVEAFYYAVESGADVISNSWGGGGYSEALKEAVDYAHSQGVIMVAAAGNFDSNTPTYPASYEHMIAVAATDSNDDKASFSNYGEWVDIAAPGVDILSLRASIGSPSNNYTVAFSGTSMACPHVAGVCGLVISRNPALSTDAVYDILMSTVDPISPGICFSDGRLNLHNALVASMTSQGHVRLDRGNYSCTSMVGVWLSDGDVEGEGEQNALLVSSGGDLENLVLSEEPSRSGVFGGSISAEGGIVNELDGMLQLSDGDVISVIYIDVNDGTGSPAVVDDTAVVDCCRPEIYDVQIDALGPELVISFETDEPAWFKVLYGANCVGPNSLVMTQSMLSRSHTVELKSVSAETEYFLVIEAVDRAGNAAVDSNGGQCYQVTTTGPGDIYVPMDYNTIQEGIARSWDGGTVWVADGVYSGVGNRDIDFRGRAITVRSENGLESCIIDCNGTEADPYRGFLFVSGEGPNSVLSGFTITNGYGPKYAVVGFPESVGGAIVCYGSSPTITGCRMEGNGAHLGGAVYCLEGSSAVIENCSVSGNWAEFMGGGVYCTNSSLALRRSSIVGNLTMYLGGGLLFDDHSSASLLNCTVAGNSVTDGYGEGGGIFCLWYSETTVANSILWGNSAAFGAEISIRETCCPSQVRVSYSDVEGGEGAAFVVENCTLEWGVGNIEADPCFVEPGYWDSNGTEEVDDDSWVGGDYYLKSEGWRWDVERNVWQWDEVTSRCIDAGNPGLAPGDELISVPYDPENEWGENVRINMGAYGGTADASMGPHRWAILGDLTNDGSVDFSDMASLAGDWLSSAVEQPGDLDRDGIVDTVDLAQFGYDWLLETSWHR